MTGQAEARALHPRQARHAPCALQLRRRMSETHRVAPMKHSKEIKYPMASSLQRRANVQVSCLNTSTCGKGSAVLSSFGNPPAGAVGGAGRAGASGLRRTRQRKMARLPQGCLQAWVGWRPAKPARRRRLARGGFSRLGTGCGPSKGKARVPACSRTRLPEVSSHRLPWPCSWAAARRGSRASLRTGRSRAPARLRPWAPTCCPPSRRGSRSGRSAPARWRSRLR